MLERTTFVNFPCEWMIFFCNLAMLNKTKYYKAAMWLGESKFRHLPCEYEQKKSLQICRSWRRLHISFLDGHGCSHGTSAIGTSGPSSRAAGPCASEASELDEMPSPDTTGRSTDRSSRTHLGQIGVKTATSAWRTTSVVALRRVYAASSCTCRTRWNSGGKVRTMLWRKIWYVLRKLFL